ncbi:NAD(P)H-dependent oxidoreductase [Sphingobacterium paludis]|uniref:NAD(P)H dehydrogenase (Quinone) n=1 Tax=Sphingobacterium paludis TaxID=1476465 RepID=A0A4R7CZM3_9SPHI|nr:NAD(P)H-dependent oxidoreductase [Sphingobacterium paludis]TDS13221.1 NAD(P)H dehydrogenase (quinone) [Sphingobacterium paludis]
MKVLLVVAHPEAKSFNLAMHQTAVNVLQQQGHEVQCTDLYRMPFDPRSDRHNFQTVLDPTFLKLGMEENHATLHNGFVPLIADEHEKLLWCDMMIWQFPLWWFSVPAILKGWVDRVFSSGRVYGAGRVPYVSGALKGKRAMLSLTTGSPASAYEPTGEYGDIYNILKHIHRGMLAYVGFSVLAPEINYAVAHLSAAEREQMLSRWEGRLKNLMTEDVFDVGRY